MLRRKRTARRLIHKTRGRIMKSIDVFRVAWGNLRRNRLRTFLTSLGVVVGIGAIVFLVSLGFGLQELVTAKMASPEVLNTFEVTTERAVKLTSKRIAKFKRMKNVKAVSPRYDVSAEASAGRVSADCAIYGIQPKYLSLENIRDKSGKPYKLKGDRVTVVSQATLKSLNIDSSQAVGKRIKLGAVSSASKGGKKEAVNLGSFTIVGVTSEKDTSYAYVPMKTLKKLGLGEYSSVKVQVASRDNLSQARRKIEDMGFKTTAAVDTLGVVEKIFSGVQFVLGLFGAIALFVASIGIFNTMTISLLERIHEIGVMKAVGITNKDVRRIFIYEAGIIGLVGGAIGVATGILTSELINIIINLIAVSAGGSPIDVFETPFRFVVGILFLALVIGLATGVYPARRAARLNPAEALRYE